MAGAAGGSAARCSATQTLERLAVHTSTLGLEPPHERTVRGVVDAIMQHQGVIMWQDWSGLQEAEDECVERLIQTVRQNTQGHQANEEPAPQEEKTQPAKEDGAAALDTWSGMLDFPGQQGTSSSGTFGF